jgi:FMN phosphatase YigB (HAD superfamily)
MSRVGFDLDGVVYDFRAAHSAFEVARGNENCALDLAADHWDYFEGWGMSLDEWLTSYAEGVDAGHVLWMGEPLPGAVEVSKRLKDAGHTIHIVTDRSIGSEPQRATREWLDSVGFVYDSLDFNKDKTVTPTDIFIEDRLQNADALNEAGTLCYLINRPWNAVTNNRRPRVDSHDEFFDRVQDFSSVMMRRA